MKKVTTISVVVVGAGGILLKISLAAFPHQLQAYSWLLPYAWAFWGGMGFVFLISLFERKADKETATTPSSKVETSVRDSGNANVTHNVYITPTGPIEKPPKAAEVPLPLPKPPERTVHVEALGLELQNLELLQDSVWTFCENLNKRCPAVVLPIHLDPIESHPRAEMSHVTSHLVLTDKNNDHKIIRIDHGLWIDATALDYVDFSFGDTKYIVVALLNNDGKDACAIGTNISDYAIYNQSPLDFFKFIGLPISQYKAQVVLNWRKEKQMFEVEIDLEVFVQQSNEMFRSE